MDLITPPGLETRPSLETRRQNAQSRRPNQSRRPSTESPKGSTIDLAWGDRELAERVTSIGIFPLGEASSDHQPILTKIGYSDCPAEKAPDRYDHANMNIKRFTQHLKLSLMEVVPPLTQAEVDATASQLVTALQAAIKASTPLKRASERTTPDGTASAKKPYATSSAPDAHSRTYVTQRTSAPGSVWTRSRRTSSVTHSGKTTGTMWPG